MQLMENRESGFLVWVIDGMLWFKSYEAHAILKSYMRISIRFVSICPDLMTLTSMQIFPGCITLFRW